MNDAHASLAARTISRAGIGRGGGRILVAEDDPVVRVALGALLEGEGFEVVGLAANGAEAVALTEHVEPEVVLSDVAMPVMNGLEATRSIKRRYPEVEVVILSATGDPAHVAEAHEVGVYRFLNKGTSFAQIIETVAKARASRLAPSRLG
ncbi:MAG: response regulator [Actinomycetota bacterium]|nr:response regulator [Actinomycetota bacterium]